MSEAPLDAHFVASQLDRMLRANPDWYAITSLVLDEYQISVSFGDAHFTTGRSLNVLAEGSETVTLAADFRARSPEGLGACTIVGAGVLSCSAFSDPPRFVLQLDDGRSIVFEHEDDCESLQISLRNQVPFVF